jgi:hypothetical protein
MFVITAISGAEGVRVQQLERADFGDEPLVGRGALGGFCERLLAVNPRDVPAQVRTQPHRA